MPRPSCSFAVICLTTLAPLTSASWAHATTVGHWRFEEGAGTSVADSSSFGNHGFLVNGPIFSFDVPGPTVPQTGAPDLYSLMVSSQVAQIPDSPSLHPASGLTIEAWVKPLEPDAWVIVGKQIEHHCCANSFQLARDYRDGSIWFDLAGVASLHRYDRNYLPVGEWHHVAGTWDGTTMRLYLDGVELDSAPFAGPITYDDNPVLIGADDDDANLGPGCCWFRGLINEVRLSDRALLPCEFLPAPPCVPTATRRATWGRLKTLYR